MKFLLTLLAFLVATDAQAVPRRYFQDANFPTQRQVEWQTITNPAAAGTTDVLSANAGNTSTAAVTVSSFVAQPDVPRNLVITPGSTTADVAACTVVVNGTNFAGQVISEDFAFLANASSATTGAKAFKTVTSVVFPANCEDTPFTASWSVGYGEKLGVKNCLAKKGHVVHSTLNGDKEATGPTMVVDDDEIEKNTADLNGTMNGSNDFELFFFQNFRCP